MSHSYEMIEKIKQFFEEDDWNYEYHEEHCIFTGGINVPGKIQSVRFLLNVGDELLTCYTLLNMNADESCRPAVAEYLSRANYGLKRGCFEIDFDDGAIRYRISIPHAEINEDYESAIRLGLLLPCRMFERYGDGLLAVMFGFIDPKDAIDKVEGTSSATSTF